jgi:carbohydrate-selective porin OprB
LVRIHPAPLVRIEPAPTDHQNEYVLETFYTLQLAPTVVMQPDLQLIWNPAFDPDPGPVTVFQLQFVVKW